jgi:hypothetical protein
MGCDTFYLTCVNYDSEQAHVVSTRVDQLVCQGCSMYGGKSSQCLSSYTYPCYQPIVNFQYGTDTCTYAYDHYFPVRNDAIAVINSNPVNSTKNVYVNKHKIGTCTTYLTLANNLAIVGVTFLSTTGLVVILWIGMWVSSCVSRAWKPRVPT